MATKSQTKETVSEVLFSVAGLSLSKIPLQFKVKKYKSVIGTLEFSKGSITWKKKGAKKPNSITWERFADIMENV